MAELEPAASKQAVGETLSRWLGWTDAIALSGALNAPATTPSARNRAVPAGNGQSEVARLRAALTRSITEDRMPVEPVRRASLPGGAVDSTRADSKADFALYRRHYAAKQQAMESSIEPMRERLRAMLTDASPSMARLAAVDAVMAPVVGAQERAVLFAVPGVLEVRFERLREQHQRERAEAALADEPDDPEQWSRPGGWLDVFHKDMQRVLLAELDLRLQPLEGLLEALRVKQP